MYQLSILVSMVFWTALALIYILIIFFTKSKSYIKDEEYTIEKVPLHHYHIKFWKNSPPGKSSDILLSIFILWAVIILSSIVWPVGYLGILVYLLLRLLRFIYRIKTKVKSISKYTHKHDKSIQHKKVELPEVKF